MYESLGERLQTTRKAKGISVNDVVYLAKIPRPVVKALENEDFAYFTSPLYARSFLKQYGEYLGTDVDEWLDDLVPSVMIHTETVESFVDLTDPVSEETESPAESKDWGVLLAPFLILLVCLAIILGGIKMYESFEKQLTNTTNETVIEPTAPVSTQIEKSVAEADDNPPVEPSSAPTSSEPEAPLRAIIVELPHE